MDRSETVETPAARRVFSVQRRSYVLRGLLPGLLGGMLSGALLGNVWLGTVIVGILGAFSGLLFQIRLRKIERDIESFYRDLK